MTVKDVFDLRKQGKIEEAYEAIHPMEKKKAASIYQQLLQRHRDSHLYAELAELTYYLNDGKYST